MSENSYIHHPCRIQFSGEFPHGRFGISLDSPVILYSAVDADEGNRFSIGKVSIGAFQGPEAFELQSLTMGARQISVYVASSASRQNEREEDKSRGRVIMPRVMEVRVAVVVPTSLTAIDVHGLSPDDDGQIWFSFEDSLGYITKWIPVYYSGSKINLPGNIR